MQAKNPDYQTQNISLDHFSSDFGQISNLNPIRIDNPLVPFSNQLLDSKSESTASRTYIFLASLLLISTLIFLSSLTAYLHNHRGTFVAQIEANKNTPQFLENLKVLKFQQANSANNGFDNLDFAVRSQNNKFDPRATGPVVDPDFYRSFSGQEFSDFYDTIEYPRVVNFSSPPPITGDIAADEKIVSLAEARGYKLRSEAEERALEFVDGQRLQTEAKEAWLKIKSAASKDGIQLVLVSGFRSSIDQQGIFVGALGEISATEIVSGNADQQIDGILRTRSIPGYSKHHTGFTIDLGCGNSNLTQFGQTECYEWMSEFNYLNAKRFGFIPSYPKGAINQGPDSEPWEYVWVNEKELRN